MRLFRALFDDIAPEPSMEAAQRRHRKRLLAYEEKVVHDLQRTWRGVEIELTSRSNALAGCILQAQDAGVAVAEAWLEEELRYQLLLKQTREQIDRYSADAMVRIESAQRVNAQAGADDAQDLMRRTEVRARFVRLPAEEVEALAGRLSDGSPLAELYSTFGDDAAKAIKEALLIGLGAGDHPYAIARNLQKVAKEMGRDRAILNARVATIGAYRTAQTGSYRANDDVITGWRWVTARQTRTCPLCWAMHGRVFPLTKSMDTHLACRSNRPRGCSDPARSRSARRGR